MRLFLYLLAAGCVQVAAFLHSEVLQSAALPFLPPSQPYGYNKKNLISGCSSFPKFASPIEARAVKEKPSWGQRSKPRWTRTTTTTTAPYPNDEWLVAEWNSVDSSSSPTSRLVPVGQDDRFVGQEEAESEESVLVPVSSKRQVRVPLVDQAYDLVDLQRARSPLRLDEDDRQALQERVAALEARNDAAMSEIKSLRHKNNELHKLVQQQGQSLVAMPAVVEASSAPLLCTDASVIAKTVHFTDEQLLTVQALQQEAQLAAAKYEEVKRALRQDQPSPFHPTSNILPEISKLRTRQDELMALVGKASFLENAEVRLRRAVSSKGLVFDAHTIGSVQKQPSYELVGETTGGLAMGGIVFILMAVWANSMVADGTLHGILSLWSETVRTTMGSIRMALSTHAMLAIGPLHSALAQIGTTIESADMTKLIDALLHFLTAIPTAAGQVVSVFLLAFLPGPMRYTVALESVHCTAASVAQFVESCFIAFQGQTTTLLESSVATLLTMSHKATLH